MTTTILQHVNVLVDDLAENVVFYRDVIGLELDDTPDHDFPTQFFKLADGKQVHMNEYADKRSFRAHFCMTVEDFNDVFRRMDAAGAIDVEPWGKVRRLDSGAFQMFARDPSGNLFEIASRPDDVIDEDILAHALVDISDTNQLYASGRDDHRRGD